MKAEDYIDDFDCDICIIESSDGEIMISKKDLVIMLNSFSNQAIKDMLEKWDNKKMHELANEAFPVDKYPLQCVAFIDGLKVFRNKLIEGLK